MSSRQASRRLTSKNLRVRAGAQSSSNVSLEIASLAEEVDVSPAADDAQLLDAFTMQLTAEQLAALPDDPEELAQVLQTLIGDDADIRVNGFAGGRLPQGTQIQEIRVRYDAASGSGNGGPRVEIRTRPGRGGWQNTFNMNMRDDSMNARNAFSGERAFGTNAPLRIHDQRPAREKSNGYVVVDRPCRDARAAGDSRGAAGRTLLHAGLPAEHADRREHGDRARPHRCSRASSGCRTSTPARA